MRYCGYINQPTSIKNIRKDDLTISGRRRRRYSHHRLKLKSVYKYESEKYKVYEE